MFERQRLDCLKATVFLILPAEGDVAVRSQGHHGVFTEFSLDEPHVVCYRKSYVVQHIAKRHFVADVGLGTAW